MARCVLHRQDQRSDREPVAVHEAPCTPDVLVGAHGIDRAGVVGQFGTTAHVVVVQVGVDHQFELQAPGTEGLDHRRCGARWVDGDCACSVRDHVRLVAEVGGVDGEDLHHAPTTAGIRHIALASAAA